MQEDKTHKKSKTNNSLEVTSFWLMQATRSFAFQRDFTKTFFAKYTFLNILTKTTFVLLKTCCSLCVYIKSFPQILFSTAFRLPITKKCDSTAGGYTWHTTGVGKTLTSLKSVRRFKAQLQRQGAFVDQKTSTIRSCAIMTALKVVLQTIILHYTT